MATEPMVKAVSVNCPKCADQPKSQRGKESSAWRPIVPMEDKGAVVDDTIDTVVLWQCPVCKNVELRRE